ncbi:Zn(2)-C6 fungal-type domain-containing protein [Mycena indigotica]|uniref:Zn(2)-C6 fungal-type domain-containing protein n=1 Tax=Mycena indigotica TaxID=2126181 RepID=A0A8H6TGZ3_9AGAR|nr:Zn(2)-C6 fungal-type domain-containing protein [Mycena indigotica]KAF7316567.1 Zn(2)-C6 fungal-type domain-containing protein [Mycena indigotica]
MSPSPSPPPKPSAIRLPSYQELVADCSLDTPLPRPRAGPPVQRYATLPPLRVPPHPLSKADLARFGSAVPIPPPSPQSPYGYRPSPVSVSAPTPTSASPPATAFPGPPPPPPMGAQYEPELRFAYAARPGPGGARAKKQALSCFFCRERKIACGRPDDGTIDGRCNQCARRNIPCTYPTISHRGQHSRLKSAARKVEHAHAQQQAAAAGPYSPNSASAGSDRGDSASPGADADGVQLAHPQYRGGGGGAS